MSSVFGWCNDGFHAACRVQYDTQRDGQPFTRTCGCGCHADTDKEPRTKKGW